MQYQAVYISYPSWEEAGPLCDTEKDAQDWLDWKLANRYSKDDWGYMMYFDDEGKQINKPEERRSPFEELFHCFHSSDPGKQLASLEKLKEELELRPVKTNPASYGDDL